MTSAVPRDMKVEPVVSQASDGFCLDGRRAIVTGGASGIGRATAEALAQRGAHVAIIDINATEVRVAAGEIGRDVLALIADVSDEEQISTAVSTATDTWGGLDIVVANAGIELDDDDTSVDQLDLRTWQRTLDVNLTGVFLTCKYGVRELLRRTGGAVVCTASPTGLYGCAPGLDAYSASKAGVYGLVRVMAAEYATRGVRVNAVLPGYIETPMAAGMSAQDVRDTVATIPMGRAGTAEEVAVVIAFLASDHARYVTGAVWAVDGGMTAV